MQEQTKEQLIEDIKILINVDGTKTHINPNYLEYFQLEELLEIKEQLQRVKKDKKSISKEYLDQIYDICGT